MNSIPSGDAQTFCSTLEAEMKHAKLLRVINKKKIKQGPKWNFVILFTCLVP